MPVIGKKKRHWIQKYIYYLPIKKKKFKGPLNCKNYSQLVSVTSNVLKIVSTKITKNTHVGKVVRNHENLYSIA